MRHAKWMQHQSISKIYQISCDVHVSRDLDSFLSILANWSDPTQSKMDNITENESESDSLHKDFVKSEEDILKIIMAISL